MAAYATVSDVEDRLLRTLSFDEEALCGTLLDDAAVIIDAYNIRADSDAKQVVSCRVVIRAMGDGSDNGVPMGATQGSLSALGYSQSWTIGSGGGAGEMYLGKLERKLLGCGERIGSHSPVEALAPPFPPPPPEVIL